MQWSKTANRAVVRRAAAVLRMVMLLADFWASAKQANR